VCQKCFPIAWESAVDVPLLLLAVCLTARLAFEWKSVRVEAGPHRNAGTCRECKYDLLGLPVVVRCPECGLDDARRRVEVARTENRFVLRWDRACAFGVIAAAVTLADLCRFLVMQFRLHEYYAFPVRERFWGSEFDWGYTPMVVAAILTGLAGMEPRWLVRRAVACGGLLVLAVSAQSWASNPLGEPPVLWFSATVTAYSALLAGHLLTGLAGFVVARRAPALPDADREPDPCESSSPTTTASTPPASGPSTAC